MNRSAITSLSALLLLTPMVAPQPAEAIDLTVKVVSATDNQTGIPGSTIYRRLYGAVEEFPTDETGSRTFSVDACDSNIAFRAKPGTWLFTEVESWTQCSVDPVLLPLPKVAFAEALLPVFEQDFSGPRGRMPELIAAQTEFLALIQAQDDAAAAAVANDIAARLRQLGETQTSEAYSVAAMYGGWRALGADATAQGGEPLLAVDPKQNLFVMTQSGRNILQDFQAEAQIPVTGVWDWRTYEALAASPRT